MSTEKIIGWRNRKTKAAPKLGSKTDSRIIGLSSSLSSLEPRKSTRFSITPADDEKVKDSRFALKRVSI